MHLIPDHAIALGEGQRPFRITTEKGRDDDPFRLGVGHVRMQQPVREREHGCVQGKGEPEGNDSDRREERRLGQRPRSIPKLMYESTHQLTTRGFVQWQRLGRG